MTFIFIYLNILVNIHYFYIKTAHKRGHQFSRNTKWSHQFINYTKQ